MLVIDSVRKIFDMDVENSDSLSPDGESGTFSVIRLITSKSSITYIYLAKTASL